MAKIQSRKGRIEMDSGLTNFVVEGRRNDEQKKAGARPALFPHHHHAITR
jgi:hypothetical protein